MQALEAISARRGTAARTLIAQNETLAELRAAARLEPFRMQRISADATLYRGTSFWRRRGLLVAVTGFQPRMQVSTAVFLQAVPAGRWDVLMLRDPQKTHFRLGCEGFGDSLTALTARLVTIARGYPKVVVLGQSMGGLVAIRAALRVPGARGVSFGGKPANDIARLFETAGSFSAFDPLCACLPKAARDMIFVYSEDHAADAHAAQEYAALVGGIAVPVAKMREHGTVLGLWKRGRLAQFLAIVLNLRLGTKVLPRALFAAVAWQPDDDSEAALTHRDGKPGDE